VELICGILRRTINSSFLLDPTTSDTAVLRAFDAFLAIQKLLSKSNAPSFTHFVEILAQFKVFIYFLYTYFLFFYKRGKFIYIFLFQRNTAYMLDLFRSIDRTHLSGALSNTFIT
jgi:hypothetical protein